ncbi:MFS general substrate transporter [Aspergillus sclerotioniger CBS 115572]|uniref:MFS general substrate transporter n=1 Tax=Aspergillus sclerotioniger CBS 115572 TaxID=1450535 RepID=A0A317VJH3_9EURO|nr:MFS general substrate transporter [Aspergillus sclerotioniger CBS 115572]PWY74483.1 MFS general substrate transporter [Aspergillus sclerotioniger CBS 115572]
MAGEDGGPIRVRYGAPAPDEMEPPALAMTPLKLKLMAVGYDTLWLSLFLSALETTIVGTSLLRIGEDLNDTSNTEWVVVVYLLTYDAFLLVSTNLGDVFGLKLILLIANSIFMIASITCAVAQTLPQLIVFRAFQGMGGSGIYSVSFLLSSVYAIANLLGPILGGAITDHTTWRWVFWINVPGAAITIVILIFTVPQMQINMGGNILNALKRADIVGCTLSVIWFIPLFFALQEAGSLYPWDSAPIIATLVLRLVLLFMFALYETRLMRCSVYEPTFPVRYLVDGVVSTIMLSMFSSGVLFYVAIIEIPQRFQIVNGLSAERSGILLLPMTIVTPFSATAAGIIAGKKPRLCEYLTLGGTALALVNGSATYQSQHPSPQYGYQVILSLVLGLIMPSVFMILRMTISQAQLASAIGANNMVRTLGGCIGLAICSSVSRSELDAGLGTFLSEAQIKALSQSTASLSLLPGAEEQRVRSVYGGSFNEEIPGLDCLWWSWSARISWAYCGEMASGEGEAGIAI